MEWTPPSEEEFNARWLTQQEALDLLTYEYDSTKQRWLMDRLKSGLIIAVARTGSPGGQIEAFVHVGTIYWRSWDDFGDEHFWDTGDAKFVIGGSTGYGDGRTIRFQDVRFDPDSFNGKVPAVRPDAIEQQSPQLAAARRGARRKDWWDHLWIEMIRRIRAGALTPSTVGELQGILEDYAMNDLGENVGDSTLKPMASNLFKYLQESGGKLGGN